MNSEQPPEMRSAVRFPLKLQASIAGPEGEPRPAETRDISSGGVLFYVDTEMTVGSRIEFTLDLPGPVLGTSGPVTVKCMGQVVRCGVESGRRAVAAMIDEYRFLRKASENE